MADVSHTQEQVEAALRRSEELHRRALEALPVHVAVIDRNGLITATNRAWNQFATQNAAGDNPSVRVGANYLEACRRAVNDDELAASALAGIEAVMDGRRSQFSMEYACPISQKQRWFLMTVAPLDSSGDVGAVIAHAEITERVRAQELLEHTRSQLAEAQRIAHLGSWEYDVATKTTIWSEEEKRIFGLDPAGPSPDYDTLLSRHIHPEDAPEMDKLFRASMEHGETFQSEHRIILPDGSVRWIYDRAQPYFDDWARVSRYIGATLDITERRAAEEALREVDRRKDEFLATLAHELRNPLAPIMNGLHILQLGCADEAEAAQVRSMISRQVDHLVRLVDDLMEVSRISRGRVELRKERIDLTMILNDAVASSQPLISELGHRLTIELPRKPVLLDADPTRLAQVFTNLLNNAAKFTKPGGRIELAARCENGEVVVSVRDNGAGISADRLPHIFALFAQFDGALHPAQPGLGIGLALARGLAELHGGRVDAYSEGLGLGSEFVVRLPRMKMGLVETPPEAIGSPTPGAPPRVLVVDDNRDAADTLSLLLEALDAEVRVAYDGLSALDIVPDFKPELVFLDLGMPGMDGFETARRLRELAEGRGLLLVALTGWSQKEDRRKGIEAGFDKHLAKPIDLGVLKTLLAGAAESQSRQS